MVLYTNKTRPTYFIMFDYYIDIILSYNCTIIKLCDTLRWAIFYFMYIMLCTYKNMIICLIIVYNISICKLLMMYHRRQMNICLESNINTKIIVSKK